jgi:hypothetical protein
LKEVIERDDGIPVGRETEEGNIGDEPRGESEEAMRKVAVIALVMMVSVALAASVMAQSAIKEECIAVTKAAAKFINEKGLDAAMAEIGNKEGKFVTKNTYFSHGPRWEQASHPFPGPTNAVHEYSIIKIRPGSCLFRNTSRWRKPRVKDGWNICIRRPRN